MRPIAVYDTNILLSGVGWRGSPHRCLELARQGSVEGLTCSEILDELAEKLTTKLKFSTLRNYRYHRRSPRFLTGNQDY